MPLPRERARPSAKRVASLPWRASAGFVEAPSWRETGSTANRCPFPAADQATAFPSKSRNVPDSPGLSPSITRMSPAPPMSVFTQRGWSTTNVKPSRAKSAERDLFSMFSAHLLAR